VEAAATSLPGRVKAETMGPPAVRVCIVLHSDLFEPWPIVRPMFEARVLRRKGREVCIFSWIKDPASPLPEEEVRDGLRVRRSKVPAPQGAFGRTIGFRRITRRFAAEIASLKPDAIVCHDLEMLWASVLAGRRLRIPVLYHAHEDWPAMVSERSRLEGFLFGLLERFLVRFVDHIYAAGEERADRFRRWRKPVTVIYGAKALSEIPYLTEQDRAATRTKAGFQSGEIVLGIAGSLGRDEGVPTVLEAMASLPSTVKLYVVGGGESKVAETKALADRRGMSSRVTFTGRLPTREYLRQIAAIDVGLALYFPTTKNQTSVVPLKLFDYMALGIPILGSSFAEMRNIVEVTCGCGTTTNPEDATAVRRAIEAFIGIHARRKEMGRRGQECFRNRYCQDRQEDALLRSHPVFGGA
jgi:glycosyltransferase involved in cell wall biosynthesis